jgi:hypothetical protein
MENYVVNQKWNSENFNLANQEVSKMAQMTSKLSEVQLLNSGKNSNHSSAKMKIYEENLKFFVFRELISRDGEIRRDKWHYVENFEENLFSLVADYMMHHFTLWELYTIFDVNQEMYGMGKIDIKIFKNIAIATLNKEKRLTPHQRKRLKKLVWDMNPILFGLIHYLVANTELFEDVQINNKPDFKVSK